ncbi:MAG: gamma-glutamyltransferase [Actinobacteria bacterium]|nr:gamma-glutamyltransferase [Actinomycetota bacterium]
MAQARVAVASGNHLGAEAAAEVARGGGNAVDACLASSVMAWVAEPCFASVTGAGFVAVHDPSGEVTIYDGNCAMPRRPPQDRGQGVSRIYLDYSNGMYTGIGGGSVAVPGVLAAVHRAWERHGSIEWAALFEPAIRAAREGLPLPKTCDYYLKQTWGIWSRYDAARAQLGVGDRPLEEGEALVQAELADGLEAIARHGPQVLYSGELGRELADAIAADGGLVTVEDLASYEVRERAPITTEAFGWSIASNPPPAVGGAVLVHMLSLIEDAAPSGPLARLNAVVAAEETAVSYRELHYGDPADIAAGLSDVLSRGQPARSSETTHSSAADRDGLACALTQSNGYGAGLIVHGMVLNNTLGEEELNPLGTHRLPPGARCHSNMAPTIARGPGEVVALGSPGGDRITGAIAQTIMSLALDGASLADALAAPRAHVARRPEGKLLCYEPGLPGGQIEVGYLDRPYDEVHMFFGGVQAASVTEDGRVDAAHDPRRSGATALIA